MERRMTARAPNVREIESEAGSPWQSLHCQGVHTYSRSPPTVIVAAAAGAQLRGSIFGHGASFGRLQPQDDSNHKKGRHPAGTANQLSTMLWHAAAF